MRHVYVVAKGEHGEGQIPEAACVTLAQAKREVLNRYDTEPAKAAAGRWVARLNGCDEVWIHRLALIGGAR